MTNILLFFFFYLQKVVGHQEQKGEEGMDKMKGDQRRAKRKRETKTKREEKRLDDGVEIALFSEGVKGAAHFFDDLHGEFLGDDLADVVVDVEGVLDAHIHIGLHFGLDVPALVDLAEEASCAWGHN